jgi:hypothetical protein
LQSTFSPVLDELITTLPVTEATDIPEVGAAAQKLASRLGLAPPTHGRYVAGAEETARRLLRLPGEAMAITLRGSAGEPSLLWSAKNLRLPPPEQARTHAVLPVSRTLPPGALSASVILDPRVQGTGYYWPTELASQLTILERTHPREVQCGDMSFVECRASKLRLAVIDGLGHGPAAREAAQRATLALSGQLAASLEEVVLRAHDHAASTRGATLGVVDIDLEDRSLRATTVGNIRIALFLGGGRIWSPCGTDAVLGHGRGSLHGKLEVRVEQHPLPSDAMLALFSDGLQSQLRLPWQRSVDPEELALQLFSNYGTASDDGTLMLLG